MNSDFHPSGASTRREELMREEEGHPTPERIATLLDPTGPLTDEAELRAHLACCRRCFGLYLELAEHQLTWRNSDKADAVPADLVHTAKAMAEEPAQPVVVEVLPTEPRQTRHARAWMAMAAVLVAASMLWLIPRQNPPQVQLAGVPGSGVTSRDELRKPIQRAVSTTTLAGMVLTERADSPGSPMRSGSQRDPALGRSLNAMSHDYDPSRTSEDFAYWYSAGLLADEDPTAGRVVAEATKRFPASARIANLAAVAAYQAGGHDDANQQLRAILRHHPNDLVALFNHTVVMKEFGTTAEYDQARADLFAKLGHDSPLRALAEQSFEDVSP